MSFESNKNQKRFDTIAVAYIFLWYNQKKVKKPRKKKLNA